MKRFERVMIAGAGIRCLTAAIALRRAGFEVAIFERRSSANRLRQSVPDSV